MARSPDGRRKDKIITDALRVALMEAADSGDRIKARVLADAMVSKAIAGDLEAAKWVTDRIEGKVPTDLNVSGNHTHTHRSEQVSVVADWLAGLTGRAADGADTDALPN